MKHLRLSTKNLILFALLSFFSASHALATDSVTCDSKTCKKTQIKRIYPTSSEKVYLLLDADTSNLTCDLLNGLYVELPNSKLFNANFLLANTSLLNEELKITVQVRPKKDLYENSASNACVVEFLYLDKKN